MNDEAAIEAAEADGRDFVTQQDVEQSAAPERPEWLPEKYKTGEDLAKAYKELESKLGGKDEEIRESLLEEIKAEAFADRPETAGDYQLPDIVDDDLAVDNELLQWWSEHSFENGYGQEEFQKGIEMYAQAINGNQPDIEAESAKLGDNATTRIEAASVFANKFFPEDALPAIERMCESHEGILALETIMDKMKDGNFSGDTSPSPSLTEASLQEMMKDPRYWEPRSRDSNFVKQVDDGFKQLYRG
ncbi:MAG: hypothetical protein CMJ25_27810 [Phycisphaerae bacterium]|nr:hypothetical protein [Phycisphaerae bacterium]